MFDTVILSIYWTLALFVTVALGYLLFRKEG